MYDDLIRELELCPDAEYGCSRCEHRVSLHCRESLMKQAADAIEELQAELVTMRSQLLKWISVEERLPEVDQPVMICAFGKSVGEGVYRGHDGFHHVWKMYASSGTYWDDEVTHWMPLPQPPKEE